jgi:hypothetical protein
MMAKRKVGSKTAFAEITERISQRPPDPRTVSKLRSAFTGTDLYAFWQVHSFYEYPTVM